MNKSFRKINKLALSSLALAASVLLQGCHARIETGSVGIVRHWDGEISSKPYHGFTFLIFDSLIGRPDTTETRIALNNLQPTDETGVKVDRLDVVLSITLNPEKVPAFYIQTKEIDTVSDESGNSFQTVGLHVVQNIGSHSIQEVSKLSPMTQLAKNIGAYEANIKKQVQKELDAGYPGVFTVVRVNVNNFRPTETVSNLANALASLDMESSRIDKEVALASKRTSLAAQTALIDAKALRDAADATKLTPEQLIAWRNAKSYGEQAAAMGAKAAPVVEPSKQPAAK